MIKVTFKDGTIIEKDYIKFESYVGEDTIHFEFLSSDMACEYYSDDILKIEKQVKDLTLEECERLDIAFQPIVNFGNKYIAIDNNYIDLSLYDYIDITKLVKGK